jgi:hypothetical protein
LVGKQGKGGRHPMCHVGTAGILVVLVFWYFWLRADLQLHSPAERHTQE